MATPPQVPQTMTPDQQSKLQQMLQVMQMSRPSATGNQSQPQPALQMPQVPGQQPTLSPGNIKLPSGQASPGVSGVSPVASPPNPTHKDIIGGIPGLVMRIKQQKHESQVEKIRNLTNQYIALQQDPNAKQARTKMAQSDPKVAKALEKQEQDFTKAMEKAVTDPNSAEAQGIQKAYMDQEGKVQYQKSLQEFQAKLMDLAARTRESQANAAKTEVTTPQTADERAIQMGTKLSAEVQAQIDARREAQQETIQLRKDQLSQQYELAKEKLLDQRTVQEDRRMYMQGMIELRRTQIENQMEIARLRLEGKTKLPGSLVSRTEQAIQIREMIDDLQKKLDDPEVRKFIGPAKGQVAGITKRFNAKFADFMSQYGALVAMQAIMHGYRGGAQMDKVFNQLLVGPGQEPDALKGVLTGISQLPDNFIEDMQKSYPGDPIWAGTRYATSSGGGGTKTFTDAGVTYNIPADQVEAFKKDHPNAR